MPVAAQDGPRSNILNGAATLRPRPQSPHLFRRAFQRTACEVADATAESRSMFASRHLRRVRTLLEVAHAPSHKSGVGARCSRVIKVTRLPQPLIDPRRVRSVFDAISRRVLLGSAFRAGASYRRCSRTCFSKDRRTGGASARDSNTATRAHSNYPSTGGPPHIDPGLKLTAGPMAPADLSAGLARSRSSTCEPYFRAVSQLRPSATAPAQGSKRLRRAL